MLGAETHDEQLDLLTAAILGGVIGAAAGYLLRPRPRPRGVLAALELAGGRTGKTARRVRRVVDKRGAQMAEAFSPDEIRDQLKDYLGEARDRISDAVEDELKDLRRAIRRRRRQLGV
ncbi:MAG: hypothetical protein ACJ79S_12540 [Gemmatimonadaceae bacterium]